jgi:alpha-tubulin suppressor-like RCC1 family protein/Tol biopolymer transport system component
MFKYFLTRPLKLALRPKAGLIPAILVLTVCIYVLSPIKGLAASPNPLDQPVQHPIHIRDSGSNTQLNPNIANAVISGYSPAQIRKAYGIDQLASTGAGKMIAIIDAYGSPTIQADLQTFNQQFGLPAANLTIAYPGGTPALNAGWAVETALDVEWAHAIAPGANILLVAAHSDSVADLLNAVDYATTHGANIVSMSWGSPEFQSETSYDYHFNHSGITYVTSSGDKGAGVNWPAASPYVVSVGATTLTTGSDGTYFSETAWSGSGGGQSAYEPEPLYQKGFQTYNTRSVPDVAFDADPNSGVAVYNQGWAVFGGTSLSAPCWAALFALSNQGGVSWVYLQATQSIYSANYHDITIGSNGLPPGIGYDLVTGLGSPKVNNLIAGNPWAWGNNNNGQLGNGTTTNSSVPVQVSISGVSSIAAGGTHNLALKSGGLVWAWGDNGDGELGNGSFANSSIPVQVSGLSGIIAISAGEYHSLALKSDGTVWAWGFNGNGQLGDGNNLETNIPVQVSSLSGITAISAGLFHSLALKSDGTIWSWGYNHDGELGNGNTTDSNLPVQVTGFTGVTAIAAGGYHSLALKSGLVWAWGYNAAGELGNGSFSSTSIGIQVSNLSGINAIEAGLFHSVALKSDGTVWTWGSNTFGQLGNGTNTNSSLPVQVSGLTGANAVAAGEDNTLVLKSDGTLRAWGSNIYGELGNGTTVNTNSPVQVNALGGITAIASGDFHSLGLKSDGSVWAWGDNFSGDLGNGSATGIAFPTQVSTLSNTMAVSAGLEHSLALKSDGTVWAWGYNGDRQLGNSNLSNSAIPVQVNGISGVTAVSTGGYHSLALKSDGTVWAWGYNAYGQLGNGSFTTSSTPVQVSGLSGITAISAGLFHSLALKSDGTVWAWGVNSNGQLGNGTTNNSNVPVQVTGLSGATAIAAGGYHSLALKSDGTVSAWGFNGYGQLGNGTTTSSSTPIQVNQFLGLGSSNNLEANAIPPAGGFFTDGVRIQANGLIRPAASNAGPAFSTTSIQVSSINGVTAIAAGTSHSLALKSDGTAWAWGDNLSGQLGNGTNNITSTPVQVSGLTGVAAIDGGGYFSLGLTSNGSVWAWGANSDGQLGNGSFNNSNVPVQVSNLTGVTAIAAGGYYSLVIKGSNQGSTTTALTSSVNPSVYGQSLTFTAMVNAVTGTGIPTGTVTFQDGVVAIGSGTLDSSGHARFSTSVLSIGSHSIAAVYSGDANYSGSTSAILVQTVNQASLINATGRIVFSSNRNASIYQIFTMNPDGTGLLKITNNTIDDRNPVWSPDGTKIAFTSAQTIGTNIYTMNSDGSNIVQLTNTATPNFYPAWLPDGKKIAFTNYLNGIGQIYIMNADGTGLTRITNNTFEDKQPTWSPTGTQIAFSSFRDGNWEIYSMNANGSNQIRLTNNTVSDEEPKWSPDGNSIVFTEGGNTLWLMNPDGSNKISLTNTGLCFNPTWSPDSQKIAFTSTINQPPGIYIMDVTGSNIVRISGSFSNGGDCEPSWSYQATSKLVFSTSPGESKAGAVFTIQPVAQLQDVSGNIVNNSNSPVTLTITGGTGKTGAILSGNTTVNAVNGVATFNGLSIDLANPAGNLYSLTATSGNLTATSSPFKVVHPGDANGDGLVTMGDVTKVERIILGLDPPTAGADANGDGVITMGDVTKIERIILGLDPLVG